MVIGNMLPAGTFPMISTVHRDLVLSKQQDD